MLAGLVVVASVGAVTLPRFVTPAVIDGPPG
jgi:hypothetical protein